MIRLFIKNRRSSIKANIFDLLLFAIIFLVMFMIVAALAGWDMQKIIYGYSRNIAEKTEKGALKKGLWSGFKKALGFS